MAHPVTKIWIKRTGLWLLAAAMLGCSALPTPPQTPARYDLGQAPALGPVAAQGLQPIALADIQTPLQADGATALHYRLAYAEAHILHAYALARWSLPPGQLVQQRIREHLSQGGRIVLSAELGSLPASVQGRQVPVLRLALEEFSHLFTSAQDSTGWVRVRATLVDPAPQGDVLMAQQLFEAQVPAKASDAAAGAQALAQGVDQVGTAIAQWLLALPSR